MREIPPPEQDNEWQDFKEDNEYEEKTREEQSVMRFGYVAGRYTDFAGVEVFQNEDGELSLKGHAIVDFKQMIDDGAWRAWGLGAIRWITSLFGGDG